MTVRTWISAAAALLVIAGCERTPERLGAEKPAATVNGVPLTHNDLMAVMGRKPHGEGEAPEVMAERAKTALNTLVRQEVLAQKALESKLDRDEEVGKRIAQVEAQYLAARRAILADAYMGREILATKPVSDDEVQTFIAANEAKLKNGYVFWQIGVDGDEAKIRQLKKSIDEGTPFEKVAAGRYPSLPEGQTPWVLPPLKYLQLPVEWRDAATSLQPGQVSDVLQAGNRYWIVKLVSVRPLAADPAGEKEAIRAALSNQQAQSQRKEKLEAVIKAADIKYGE